MSTIDAAARDLLADETYFLSAANPVATSDQRYLETLALELLDLPAVGAAVSVAIMRFEMLAGADLPEVAREGLPARVRQAAFRSLTLALNSDSDHPRVLGNILGPEHEWFGLTVPGSRGPGTGENADCWYSAAPLDPHSRFELLGQVQDPPIGDCPMVLAGNAGLTQNVAHLDWRDVVVDDDGTFTITIDPSPAGGRSHHLQSTSDTKYLFIRDCRLDWDQQPNAYRIRRLDPPLRGELTIHERVALASRYIVEDVPLMWFFRQVMAGLGPNSITEPAGSAPVGGIATQALVRGRLQLEEDQAYVLTLGSRGAGYWSLSSYDWWAMGGDLRRLVSLNSSQAIADPDGTYTLVFAGSDPGVANWIDTGGRRDTHFLHRWQQLPACGGGTGPTATGAVANLADLDAVLPDDVARCGPEERAAQLRQRARQVGQRYAV
jgi:hypothetical protein